MNKLIMLIYVNILDLGDINRVQMSKQADVNDSSELKLIFLAIIGIGLGIALYYIYNLLGSVILNKVDLLNISCIVCTIMLLFNDLLSISGTLFNTSEFEVLYSLPLTKEQIILSKLFKVYLKNLFYLLVICLPAILAYNNYVKVDETMGFVYLLIVLTLPLVPIVIATICSFLNNYLKVNYQKIVYLLSKILIYGLLLGGGYLLFRNIHYKSLSGLVSQLIKKINIIDPFLYLANLSLNNLNVVIILLALSLPIILFILFIKFLSYNYLKMGSLLRGVKIKKKVLALKVKQHGKFVSLFKKELISLWNNKVYLRQVLSLGLGLSLIFFLVCVLLPINKIEKMEYFKYYFNLYAPGILALLASINCYSVSSLSIERENILLYKVIPLRFANVLLVKFLVSTIINGPFIIINWLILNMTFNTTVFMKIASFVFPFVACIFTSLLGILLDFKFCAWKEKDEDLIVKQRLIIFIPLMVSLVIGIVPFLLPVYRRYVIAVCTHIFILILGSLIILGYILLNYQKMKEQLFK